MMNCDVGLVDAHTHAVWAGDRVHEFAMKVCKLTSSVYLDLCVRY